MLKNYTRVRLIMGIILFILGMIFISFGTEKVIPIMLRQEKILENLNLNETDRANLIIEMYVNYLISGTILIGLGLFFVDKSLTEKRDEKHLR